MKMDYSEFLFSQLFMEYLEGNATFVVDLTYDKIFPEMLRHKELFEKSTHNSDLKSEYECICDYLNTLKKEDIYPPKLKTFKLKATETDTYTKVFEGEAESLEQAIEKLEEELNVVSVSEHSSTLQGTSRVIEEVKND